MAEEIKLETNTDKVEKKPDAERVYILGVPVDEIPPAPWTVESLGWERYVFLSRYGGYQRDPQPSFTPALDPRTFAHGVAYRAVEKLLSLPAVRNSDHAIKLRGIITKVLDGRIVGSELRKLCSSDEAAIEIAVIVEEVSKLTDFMNELCGPGKGTPYSKGAIEGAPKIARELIKPRKFIK